jgi:hypothetical protein
MKTKHAIISLLALGLLTSFNATSSAATIEKKDGTAVVGNISGLIVQRGEIKKSPSEKNPGKTVQTASYYLTNGAEISAIDKKGLHKDSDKIVFIVVSQEEFPLEDLDVLNKGIDAPPSFFSVVYTKAGGTVVRMGGRSAQPSAVSKDVILGEYRQDRDTREAQLIPAIEVVTAAGPVKIAVSDIVGFE